MLVGRYPFEDPNYRQNIHKVIKRLRNAEYTVSPRRFDGMQGAAFQDLRRRPVKADDSCRDKESSMVSQGAVVRNSHPAKLPT
ncbi:hypothetical protein MLD38_020852 [Melastoma candidum]|uniref:Uncharacterized protein n=1 Tax=Melastoma candidum TaxID=119954 RepID=A0ACB9QMB7_9MYRT|nr:hypothetical protein MLD38_020852 [Melastoma candidum]